MKKWMLFFWSFAPFLCFASPPWHGYAGNNWVWSIAGGPAWSSSGMTQDLTNKAGLPVSYTHSSDHTSALGVGELFLGVYRELNHAVQGQIGLEVAYGGNVGISGTILGSDNPLNSSIQADYQYQIYQIRVGGKAKLILVDFPTTSLIQPYVAVGMGTGFNQSIDYKLTPANSQNIYPIFSNKNVNAFTYNAGGGIQIPVNPFMQLGLGYEYASWGKSSLGQAPGLANLPAPSLDNVSVNTVLITLSYTA